VSIQELIDLFHHRWSAAVLAELFRQKGSRFVTLSRTLEVSRESLRRTLAALIEQGLVARNPGYGHPLRPEYVLTDQGLPVAGRCRRLLSVLDGKGDVVLRKWSVPVLAVLDKPARFSELRAALPGVTARALAISLRDLQKAGLVERRVDEEAHPPTVEYAATPAAKELQQALDPV
jgi:DNA-binding HxlR family transcriptional regulator